MMDFNGCLSSAAAATEVAASSPLSCTSMQPEVWCHLPAEILYQVLLRLPVSELLRLASVCKQWRDWTTSSDFRSRWVGPCGVPYLLAVRSLNDLRFAPVMSSNGSKFHGLDLEFLYSALVEEKCRGILSISSNRGLLCVGAFRENRYLSEEPVILVCNPLTRSWKRLAQWGDGTNHVVGNPLNSRARQIFIRADKMLSSYKIYIVFNRFVVVYESTLDAFTVLHLRIPTADDKIVWTAFVRDAYYVFLTSFNEIDVYTCNLETMVLEPTNFCMDSRGYKFLAYDDRVFCAKVSFGDCRDADEDQYFPLKEMDLSSEEWDLSKEDFIPLGGIELEDTLGWHVFNLVEHKGYILLGVYNASDKLVHWLEAPVGLPPGDSGGKCRFPALPHVLNWNATTVKSIDLEEVQFCNIHVDLKAEV